MADSTRTLSYETADRLKIFVSSRIGECRDERRAVRDAVNGLNHLPVLFEHLGSRPFSPRKLYEARLRDSQIMVAIYRDGYGYIDAASRMTISGLEDEYRIAVRYGIPILMYVYEDATSRDPRLAALIEEAGPHIVFSKYRQLSQLEELVRNDVTAEITRRYLSADYLEGVLSESSGELLRRGVLRQGELIERPELLNEIAKELESRSVVCVWGPAGIGKTVAVAQFSELLNGTYLRLNGLNPKEIFSVCADALRTEQGVGGGYVTLAGARLGLSAAWAERDKALLVLDECDYVDDVIAALDAGGGLGLDKRVVFTSRTSSQSAPNVQVPELTKQQAIDLLNAQDIFDQDSTALRLPLAIQQKLSVDEAGQAQAEPRSKELAAYLAISPKALTANQVMKLLGDDALSIETLYELIGRLGRLVDDSPRGLRLLHAESAQQLRDELSKTPQRLSFYATRVLKLFEDDDDATSAYKVASLVGDELELKYAAAAVRQAAMSGDWRFGVAVADHLLQSALTAEHRTDAFRLMLELVYPLELMGDAVRASDLLAKAETYASTLSEADREALELVKLESRARRTLSSHDVAELQAIYESLRAAGLFWESSRIALELSSIFMAAKDYESAVTVLRPAIGGFDEFGDAYGIDLTERNLASSLSGIPGNEEEVDELVARVEARANDGMDPRRQRAWVCNLLTRRYRKAGRLDEARNACREILEIADELGDLGLRAITSINLGNVEKDADDPRAAMSAYDEAARSAQSCGRLDIEADASRLRAEVLNDFELLTATIPDRHQQAANFAMHAIGLLRGTIYQEALARAYVELGDAHEVLNRPADAATAYFDALAAFRKIPDSEAADASFRKGALLAMDADPEFYVSSISRALEVEVEHNAILGDQFAELIIPLVERLPQSGFVKVLGRHLQFLRDKLPPMLKPVLFEVTASAITSQRVADVAARDPWRLLYLPLITPMMAHDNQKAFVLNEIAETIARSVDRLDVRYDTEGYTWTVVINMAVPIIITVETVDQSFLSAVVALNLACFLRAFEDDFAAMVGIPQAHEVWISVMNYSEMPDDLRNATQMLGAEKGLEKTHVVVTRPRGFDISTPTFVVVKEDFLDHSTSALSEMGSLQYLLAKTTTELVVQLTKGEIDEDAIMPKIASTVRKTLI